MSINQKVNTNILLNLLHPKYKNNIKTNGPQRRQETVPTIYQNKRKYKGKGLWLANWPHCRRTRLFERSSRVLLPTTLQKCTFDGRRKDLSGRTAWLTSQ